MFPLSCPLHNGLEEKDPVKHQCKIPHEGQIKHDKAFVSPVVVEKKQVVRKQQVLREQMHDEQKSQPNKNYLEVMPEESKNAE